MTVPPVDSFAARRYEPRNDGLDMPRLWVSDRELLKSRRSRIPYSSRDFRRELKRVERRMSRLVLVCIGVAAVAGIAIVGLLFQIIQ